jgi:hypothetical protein
MRESVMDDRIVMDDWWRLHNLEHHDLYSSPTIIQEIRSRTIRWEKHYIYIYIHTQERSIQDFGEET